MTVACPQLSDYRTSLLIIEMATPDSCSLMPASTGEEINAKVTSVKCESCGKKSKKGAQVFGFKYLKKAKAWPRLACSRLLTLLPWFFFYHRMYEISVFEMLQG